MDVCPFEASFHLSKAECTVTDQQHRPFDSVIKNEIKAVFQLKDKFFEPDFGSRVSKLLFENVDDITASQIQEEIEFSISNYEPRVNLTNVTVVADNDNALFDAILQLSNRLV